MGSLLTAFTFDRNVVRGSIDKSADTVFSILSKVYNNEPLEDKVDTNICSALSSYFGMVENGCKRLTPLGQYCLQFSEIDAHIAYRWALTRSLEKYQLPNGTSSSNNAIFTNADVKVKPFKLILGLCYEIFTRDSKYPFLTYKELLTILEDDSNWSKGYNELVDIILSQRKDSLIEDIAKHAQQNTILNLEPNFSISRDNINGFLGKTLEQTGLFSYIYEGKNNYAMSIKSDLDRQQENWIEHILRDESFWDTSSDISWEQYLLGSQGELPRPFWMNISPLLIPFIIHIQKNGLYYNFRVIQSYIASLISGRFVVLAGNSGTGKSSISTEFASYMGATALPRYGFVEVGANWKNNEYIIGYWDSLATPPTHRDADILSVFKAASVDDLEPYFVTLDEMNLSHIEWYFSDYLSVMERNATQRFIKYAETGSPGSGSVKLGDNIFVTGTVNVDYTTFTFSPKVLDRAFVIEVQTIPPTLFGKCLYGAEPSLEPAIESKLNNDFKNLLLAPKSRKIAEDLAKTKWGKKSIQVLSKIWDIVKPMGFQFGPRVVADSLIYLNVIRSFSVQNGESWNGDEMSFYAAIDDVVMEKILTKIDGQRGKLDDCLHNLSEYLKNNFNLSEESNLSYNKTMSMLNQLQSVGYTSFFGC